MATMNVSLSDPMKNWIKARLEDGSFSNTSDYLCHLIRRDQERAQAIEALQQVIDEGVKSGDPELFDFKAFKVRMQEQHAPK